MSFWLLIIVCFTLSVDPSDASEQISTPDSREQLPFLSDYVARKLGAHYEVQYDDFQTINVGDGVSSGFFLTNGAFIVAGHGIVGENGNTVKSIKGLHEGIINGQYRVAPIMLGQYSPALSTSKGQFCPAPNPTIVTMHLSKQSINKFIDCDAKPETSNFTIFASRSNDKL